MEKPKEDFKIVKSIPIGENKNEFELFILETQERLEPNQFVTLPLKKVPKVIERDGKIITVLETEVNIKRDIRIIEML